MIDGVTDGFLFHQKQFVFSVCVLRYLSSVAPPKCVWHYKSMSTSEVIDNLVKFSQQSATVGRIVWLAFHWNSKVTISKFTYTQMKFEFKVGRLA